LSSWKIDKSTLLEIVLLPAALVLLGYAILWAVDGSWWGIAIWILTAPIVYFTADFLLLGRRRPSDATRRRARVVTSPGRHSPTSVRTPPAAAPPHWSDQQDVSAGAEILRRGRRYDHRA
jgi:hypothetical protein